MKNDSKSIEIFYKDEGYRINACIFEVNRKLGIGFLESVYQEALEIELQKAGIPFEPQKTIHILYDGQPLKQFYVAAFVCFGNIIGRIEQKIFHRRRMSQFA